MIFLLACVYPAFADVPVTGRTQPMSFSRAAVQAVAAQAYQLELSRFSAQDALDTDSLILNRVRRISAPIIAQAILFKPAAANWQWEVHVTSDPQISAYSRAGGKLLVSSYFINFHQLNDGELAVVLAHEVAHVIAEHVREQISTAATLNPPPPNLIRTVEDVIDSMEADITVFMRLQPLSRLQEMEADDIGIELAARAGNAPEYITSFYDKLTKTDSGQSLFDTHGSPQQRAKFVHGLADYAQVLYEEGLASPKSSYTFVQTSNK